jgi:fibrillarin-like rRNA methylase
MALQQLETAVSELFSMDENKKNILYELGSIAELMDDKEKAAEYYKQIYAVDIGYKDIADKIESLYKK